MTQTLMLQDAETLLVHGRLDLAAQRFHDVLESDPHCFNALLGLGVICAQQGQFAEAIPWLSQAVIQSPDSCLAHYNLGIAHKSLQQLDAAIEQFESVIALDSSHLGALNSLGNCFIAKGQIEDATATYTHALALAPDNPQTLYNYALLLQSSGHVTEAAALYEKAVTLRPDFAAAWTNLGTILQDTGAFADSELCFRQALSADPTFADASINLGLCLFRQNRADEALSLALSTASQPDHADFPHYSLGLLFAKLGQNPKAQQHLARSLERDPEDTQGARLVMAGLGTLPVPDRSSDAQMQKLYTARAASWDKATESDHSYRGHELVADLFKSLYPEHQALSVLDAGCGTGLVGLSLGPVGQLEGVDLSAPMLAHAQVKGIYTSLHQADMLHFMEAHEGSYDVVTSAATLIHFGDLRPVFTAAKSALRPGGRFLFTVFPGPDSQPTGAAISLLHGHAEGGCYLHSRPHLIKWAEEVGFSVEVMKEDVHEFDRGNPITALVVALQSIAPSP